MFSDEESTPVMENFSRLSAISDLDRNSILKINNLQGLEGRRVLAPLLLDCPGARTQQQGSKGEVILGHGQQGRWRPAANSLEQE